MVIFLTIIIIILTAVIVYLLIERKGFVKTRSFVLKQNSYDNNEFKEVLEGNEDVADKTDFITKSYAMALINQYSEKSKLNLSNTSYSGINKAIPEWWFNISPEKFEEDLHLIFAKKESFIWVYLPKGSVTNPKRKFRFREDKELIEIKVEVQSNYDYMKDKSSGGIGFGFKQFIQKEFTL